MRLIYLSDQHSNEAKQEINNINKHVSDQKPLVIYFYKENCPYCVQTSNEWTNIPQHITEQDNNLMSVKADGSLYNLLDNVGEQPIMFPTIRYVHQNKVVPFTKEGSHRTAYNLAKWIEEMTQQQQPPNVSKLNPNYSVENYKQKQKSIKFNSPIASFERPTSFSNFGLEPESEEPIQDSKSEEIKSILKQIESSPNPNSTSNKYPPYSNRFIAHNFNSQRIGKSSSGRSIGQRSSSRRSIGQRSSSISRSYPRFKTVRPRPTLETTAMI